MNFRSSRRALAFFLWVSSASIERERPLCQSKPSAVSAYSSSVFAAFIREAPAAVSQPNTAVTAAEHHPVARVALMANSPMAPRTVISAAPAALPEVNIPAVPKQAMAVMPKRTAKVMPVASMATPALWRFFALVRRLSMGVGTGFFAKKLRAQPGIPPAFSPLGAAFRASSARF